MTRAMQFLKKNYEKVLLGLVLLGLVAAVAFLPFRIASEKATLKALRERKFDYKINPLPPLDTNRFELALKQAATPLNLDLSTTNKLLNPIRWLKSPNGPVKMELGSELEKLEITKATPLYLNITLENVNVSDAGARYGVAVEQQAAARPNQRSRRLSYVSIGDKKDLFTLREVKGPPENPTALVLELSDSGEKISISKDKAFHRVDGYTADLRYAPENKSFLGKRVGDKIPIAGEEYNIVAIFENEVVLSARSNGKKYTIRSNPAP
jgi:hypothetical protein